MTSDATPASAARPGDGVDGGEALGPRLDVPAAPWPWLRVADGIGVAAVAVAALALRLLQRSPLWLDEALSSNIAALPVGDIPGALERDGHPPLYYVLLHLWQDVAGTGDEAVRLLSGLIGLALLPLAWVAAGRLGGRRAAWAAVLLVALNPFVIRYATEARMYELVMVLALAGWLVAERALRPQGASPGRLVVLALLTGALLWTHYWGMWLTAAAGAGVLVRAARSHRRGRPDRRDAALRVAGALVAGALTFLPWVPNLLYQSAHTGTPWATPSIPTEIVASSWLDLGGGGAGESVILAMGLTVLVLLGLCGRAGAGTLVELDLRSRPEARPLALLVTGTLAVALAASYAAQAGYASRYFSVVVPFVLVLAGLGMARIGGPVAFRLVLAGVLLLGAVAGVRAAVTDPRSQAGEIAGAIEARGAQTGTDPLVLVCPDQLGPALGRELPAGTDVATYPRFAPPELVDWVDYEERLATADPVAFAREALRRAGDRDVWLVWSGLYRTHEGTCEAVATELQRGRPAGVPVVVPDPDAYEAASANLFPA